MDHTLEYMILDLIYHSFIKQKLIYFIKRTILTRAHFLKIACSEKDIYFISEDHRNDTIYGSCQKVCCAVSYLLNSTFIRFNLYRLIPCSIGTKCAPLVADCFCYERDFMQISN